MAFNVRSDSLIYSFLRIYVLTVSLASSKAALTQKYKTVRTGTAAVATMTTTKSQPPQTPLWPVPFQNVNLRLHFKNKLRKEPYKILRLVKLY
jgi:hypothetical protein